MKTSKKIIALLTTVLILMLSLAACGGEAESEEASGGDEVVTLKFATYYGPTHALTDTVDFFLERVDELSNGTIKIDYYPAEQMGKTNDLMDLCSQGTADMAVVVTANFAGKLPLNTALMLPYFTTAQEGTAIQLDYVEQVPEALEEYTKYGIRPFFCFTTNHYQIQTVDKPIESPEDLEGLRCSSSGGWLDKVMSMRGIDVVSLAPTEIYESLEKNIIKGTSVSLPSVLAAGYQELEKYSTYGGRFGASPATWCINENAFNELSEEQQNALMQAGREASEFAAKDWDRQSEEARAELEAQGMIFYDIPEEDLDLWQEPVQGVEKDWIKEMTDSGHDGQKIWDQFIKIAESHTGE